MNVPQAMAVVPRYVPIMAAHLNAGASRDTISMLINVTVMVRYILVLFIGNGRCRIYAFSAVEYFKYYSVSKNSSYHYFPFGNKVLRGDIDHNSLVCIFLSSTVRKLFWMGYLKIC